MGSEGAVAAACPRPGLPIPQAPAMQNLGLPLKGVQWLRSTGFTLLGHYFPGSAVGGTKPGNRDAGEIPMGLWEPATAPTEVWPGGPEQEGGVCSSDTAPEDTALEHTAVSTLPRQNHSVLTCTSEQKLYLETKTVLTLKDIFNSRNTKFYNLTDVGAEGRGGLTVSRGQARARSGYAGPEAEGAGTGPGHHPGRCGSGEESLRG